MDQNVSIPQPILKVKDLSVMRGEYLAVDNVSFELEKGMRGMNAVKVKKV